MTPEGAISLFDVRTELGRTGGISLLDDDVRRLGGNALGAVDLYGRRLCEWINTNNYPNPNAYYPPAGKASRLVIAPGTVIYGNSYGVYALAICPGNGANVTVDNYGTIEGAAGAPNGGAGGNAFYSYAGDNVTPGRSSTVHLRNFGSILAGGGGGGKGGTGGTGGGGYYVATGQDGNATTYALNSYCWYDILQTQFQGPTTESFSGYWAGSVIYSAGAFSSGPFSIGGYTYYVGNQYRNSATAYYNAWGIYRTYPYNVYTSGGAGGAGGSGGYGQGFDHGQSAGAGGAGGGSPGTNAGWGGTGGTGGYGATWGATGNTGSTGNTGGAGNNGGGAGGSAGAAGGAPGHWWYRPSGDVVFTYENHGTIAGA